MKKSKIGKLLTAILLFGVLFGMTITANAEIQRHTVTFMDGSTVLSTEQVEHGSWVSIIPEVPEVPGYKFDGWYLDETLTEKYKFGTLVTEDITLYVKRTSKVWVCGVEILESNAADVLGDGTVSYDAVNAVLTLKNANLDVTGSAIVAVFDEEKILTIHGEGENTITAREIVTEGVDEDGPWVSREGGFGIEVQGDGNLLLTGTLGDITTENAGIYVTNSVTIDGTVGNITSGDSCLVASWGDVVINGKVGNIVSAREDDMAVNGIEGANVVIKGVVGDITAEFCGICSSSGDVTISGTVGDITGGTEEMGSSGIEAYQIWDWSDEAEDLVSMGGGNLFITGTVGKITGHTYGVYTEGDLSIGEGCIVEIEATDTDVDSGPAAINVGGGIMQDGVVVTVPVNAQLGGIIGDEGEEGTTTFCDSEGNYALIVKFEPGFTVCYWTGDSEDYIPDQVYPAGSAVTKPEDPTLEGYNFAGWYMDEEYTEAFDFSAKQEAGAYLNLYAKWEEAEHKCLFDEFTDLDPTMWYHDYVEFALDLGLMKGMGGGKFEPDGTVTRAMFVTMLWRMDGEMQVEAELTFKDVPADIWYTEAVRWAASEELVLGYSDAEFAPDAFITREQFVTILWRYANYKGYDTEYAEETDISGFKDAASISEYAVIPMKWGCGTELVIGDGVNLTPTANATRAQAATLLQRMIAYMTEQ